MKTYIVVGGNLHRMHTGTITYTSLRELGRTQDPEEAKKLVEAKYEECGGLIHVVTVDHDRPLEMGVLT